MHSIELRLLLLLLALAGECHAAPPCAETIVGLRALLADDSLPLAWIETTMDDEKPLVLSILERNGALVLEFVKASEGLWVEGASVVCWNGTAFDVRIAADQVRLGPAANWATRYALSGGSQFTLTKVGAEQLRLQTTGWSGMFCPRERK